MRFSCRFRLRKKDGQFRNVFSLWTIPKRYKDKYFLIDGMRVHVKFRLPIGTQKTSVRLTSGGEFRFSHEIANMIRDYAGSQSEIQLSLSIDPLSLVELEQLIRRNAAKVQRSTRKRTGTNPKIGSDHPLLREATVNVRDRDPRVKTLILQNAAGKCQVCCKDAPFRQVDGELFLEIHHVHWLSNDGPDRVWNAIALCPNCHREAHHGNLHDWVAKLPKHFQELALNNVQSQST